jgi:hypothetical protein
MLCVSSFLALADQGSAISRAAERSEIAAAQKSDAKKQEHAYGPSSRLLKNSLAIGLAM